MNSTSASSAESDMEHSTGHDASSVSSQSSEVQTGGTSEGQTSTTDEIAGCDVGETDVVVSHRAWIHFANSRRQADWPTDTANPGFPFDLRALYWKDANGKWSSTAIENINADCSVARNVPDGPFWIMREAADLLTGGKQVNLTSGSGRRVDLDRHFSGAMDAQIYVAPQGSPVFGELRSDLFAGGPFVSISCPDVGFRASMRDEGLDVEFKMLDLPVLIIEQVVQLVSASQDIGPCVLSFGKMENVALGNIFVDRAVSKTRLEIPSIPAQSDPLTLDDGELIPVTTNEVAIDWNLAALDEVFRGAVSTSGETWALLRIDDELEYGQGRPVVLDTPSRMNFAWDENDTEEMMATVLAVPKAASYGRLVSRFVFGFNAYFDAIAPGMSMQRNWSFVAEGNALDPEAKLTHGVPLVVSGVELNGVSSSVGIPHLHGLDAVRVTFPAGQALPSSCEFFLTRPANDTDARTRDRLHVSSDSCDVELPPVMGSGEPAGSVRVEARYCGDQQVQYKESCPLATYFIAYHHGPPPLPTASIKSPQTARQDMPFGTGDSILLDGEPRPVTAQIDARAARQ